MCDKRLRENITVIFVSAKDMNSLQATFCVAGSTLEQFLHSLDMRHARLPKCLAVK